MIQEARQKTDRCKFYRDLLVFFLCALVWCGTGFTWPVYGEDTEIFVQLGHSGDIGGGCVTSVAFSSDRMFALSGSRDKTLKLWDVSTGREIRTFEGHTASINSVAFSPNGKLALSGSDDKTLKLWDITTGSEVRAFRGHTEGVNSVAFSSDGNLALSGSGDKTVKLWNVSTGGEIQTFIGHSNSVTSVAFSSDRMFALSGSRDKTLKLWDVSTGRAIRTFEGHSDGVNSVAYSPNGKLALSGSDDNTLKLWDIPTGKLIHTFEGHKNSVTSIAFSPNGKSILSGSEDRTIKLWNISTDKEIITLIGFENGEWIAITPEGYFNSSPADGEHINVRKGLNVYGIDQFFEQFFNPTMVAQVLHGKEIKIVKNISEGLAPPPNVRIVSPKPEESFSKDSIQVSVLATDMGGGIDEIRLYHNDKVVVKESKRGIAIRKKKGVESKDFQVTLLEGLNRLRAVAFSRDRTESNPYELIVHLTAPSKEATLNLLVVGINKYKNSDLNLNYAEDDARAITRFFKSKEKSLFKNINVTELYNENATGQSIRAAFEALQDTEAQDVVVIYLAGHGETVKDKWYFIPHEVIYPERERDVVAKGISSEDISQYIKDVEARKVLMLMDSCKAGAAIEVAFRGAEDRRALMQLARATGIFVVAASTKSQFAAEVKELGHGVFTHTLLNGLNGAAAAGGQNTITVRRLTSFVEERLPEISRKYKREAQYPVVYSRGMDFPLAVK